MTTRPIVEALRGGRQMALDEPVYENMIQERDVMVEMRDGVHLAADIYRPKSEGAYPVLYA